MPFPPDPEAVTEFVSDAVPTPDPEATPPDPEATGCPRFSESFQEMYDSINRKLLNQTFKVKMT